MYGAHTNAYGSKLDLAVKGQTSVYDHHFSTFGRPPISDDLCKDSVMTFSVLEKIFKGFYHIWAWQPSWSVDHNHFSNLSFPCPKEPSHEI